MLVVNDNIDFEKYHLYPNVGLLNDPNGLVYFKGKYHVFFQWNPYGCNHRYKEWGHFISDDLKTWERVKSALEPSIEDFDSAGIYSGTAIVKDERLYVFYTGNVRDEEGISVKSSQMSAVSSDGIHFEKLGQLFPHPEGFTKNVRDPMVWQGENGHYFLILGAQRDNVGDIIIYESYNFKTWQFRGSLIENQLLDVRGYMLECPSLITVDKKQLLIFSPQGLDANLEKHRYENIYNTGYVVGKFDEENARFIVETKFEEVDRGFEFYAPQIMLAPDNRRVMWGWAGVMDSHQEATVPTIEAASWVHVLSVPRELHINNNNQLVQHPITEIIEVPKMEKKTIITEIGQYRVKNTADWVIKIYQNAVLKKYQDRLYFERRQWATSKIERRQITGNVDDVLLIVDRDIVEVYTMDGLQVMTGRVF